MKHITYLGWSTLGVLGVALAAGCSNLPFSFPNPVALPSGSTTTVSQAPRVIISRVTVNAAAPYSGKHELYLKNLASDSVDLSSYMLTVERGDTNALATSSLTFGPQGAVLPAGQMIRVFLYDSADTLAEGQAKTANFASGAVQYGKGGALSVFNSKTATASANMADFLQYGATGTRFETAAAAANLWKVSTAVATTSTQNVSGVNLNVLTEGATGSTNWTFSTF